MKSFTSLKLLAAGIVTIASIATGVVFAQPAQAASNKQCAVEAYVPKIGQQMRDMNGPKKFSRQGNTVYVGVKVTGKNCTSDVVMAGWLAKSLDGRPYNQQDLYTFKRGTNLKPGNHRLAIKLPADPQCFFQIDLVRGSDPTGRGDGALYGPGRLLAAVHGGKKDCYTNEKIRVCLLGTNRIIRINADQFNPQKHTRDLSKCRIVRISVCELATNRIIRINQNQFNPTLHTRDLSQCEPVEPKDIEVCEIATGDIIIIDETTFNPSVHSRDLAVCDSEPRQIIVCDLTTKNLIRIDETAFDSTKHSLDVLKCEEPTPPTPDTPTPVTPVVAAPTTIAKTGPADIASSLAGIFGITSSAYYYFQSRRRG